MGRIIAIDYGLRRVGIAVTDPLQIIATSLVTISTIDTLSFLQDYIKKEEVEAFVIGFPADLKNLFSPIITTINKFIVVLAKNFPTYPIFKQDERYTSKLALASLVEGGFSKKTRRNKANIDKVSATIILQSFLNSHTKNRI